MWPHVKSHFESLIFFLLCAPIRYRYTQEIFLVADCIDSAQGSCTAFADPQIGLSLKGLRLIYWLPKWNLPSDFLPLWIRYQHISSFCFNHWCESEIGLSVHCGCWVSTALCCKYSSQGQCWGKHGKTLINMSFKMFPNLECWWQTYTEREEEMVLKGDFSNTCFTVKF